MSKEYRRKWTEEEIKFLKHNKELSHQEIAKRLNRSVFSVEQKRVRLFGPVKKIKTWSNNEVQVLMQNPDISTEALSETLDRTQRSVARKKSELGITASRWTKTETDTVTATMNLSCKQVGTILGRTAGSIESKRGQLGLRRTEPLSDSDIVFIGNFYSVMTIEDIATYLDAPKSYISSVVVRMGGDPENRYTAEYKNWINNVLSMDQYRCVVTHTKDSLQVHHLDGYNWCREHRTNVRNGISLCKEIHDEFHNIFGRGNNTKKQFVDYIKNYLFLPLPVIERIDWYVS